MESKVRIDKWLWAARFFKTRSMASRAVNGGRVHLNGRRIKAAKAVVPGDELRINRNEVEFIVTVLKTADKRGPAKVAQTLYEESDESIRTREMRRKERKLHRLSDQQIIPGRRPSKRDRRKIREFIRKQD